MVVPRMKQKISWAEFLYRRRPVFIDKVLDYERLISSIIRFTPKNGTILEVGAGTGLISMLLSQAGYRVTATDLDDEVLEKMKTLASSYNFSLKIEKADVLRLPYRDKSFDTVFSQGLLEHFSDEDVIQALREQGRVANTVIMDVPISRFKKKPFGDERLLSVRHWKKLVYTSGLRIVYIYGRELAKYSQLFPQYFVRRFSYLFGKKLGLILRKA